MFPARPHSKENPFQSGQSLIEIIATIAIGTVLILALVALSVRSNSSSDFSKAQDQAANLASEGMEIIRSIKASNAATIRYSSGSCDTGTSPTNYSWTDFFSLGDISPETGVGCDFGRAGHLYAPGYSSCPAGQNWCLQFETGGAQTTPYEGRVFTQTVYVADTPVASGGKSGCNANVNDYGLIKQFTVKVSWGDSSGSHNSTTTSCIKVL